MNNKEANVLAQLEQKPKFAFLQGICGEIAQGRENAQNHKHDALHMQTVMWTQSTLQKALKNSKAAHDTARPTRTGGLGASAPSNTPAPSTNHGLGSSAPSSSPNVGSSTPAAGSPGRPYNSNDINSLVTLWHKLATSDLENPNTLIAFITQFEAISNGPKTPGAAELFNQFAKGIAGQISTICPLIKGNDGAKETSFASAIALTLVVVAIYQAEQQGNPNTNAVTGILQGLASKITGGDAFSTQLKNSLETLIGGGAVNGISIHVIFQSAMDHGCPVGPGGLPQISKIFLQQVMEFLFQGNQASGNSQQIENIQKQIRSAYQQAFLDQFNSMVARGASVYELLAFVTMEYNMDSDYAGSYMNNINDLSGVNSDATDLLALFQPGSAPNANQVGPLMPAMLRMAFMWSNTANIYDNTDASGSLAAAISKQFMDALNGMKFTTNSNWVKAADPKGAPPSAIGALANMLGIQPSAITLGDGHYTVHLDSTHTITLPSDLSQVSIGSILTSTKTRAILEGPDCPAKTHLENLIGWTVGLNNSMPDSPGKPSGVTPAPAYTPFSKRSSAIDSVTSSIQAIEAQVTSQNETSKAQYQQANQTSANMLSTVGDIMKNTMKQLTVAVQNQRQGA